MRDSTFASFSCGGRLSLVGLRPAGSALEPVIAAANLVWRPPPQGLAAGPRSASRRGSPAGGIGPLREPPGPVVGQGVGGPTALRDADRQAGRRRLVIVGRAARGTPFRRPGAGAARAAGAAGAALIGHAAAEPALGDARPCGRRVVPAAAARERRGSLGYPADLPDPHRRLRAVRGADRPTLPVADRPVRARPLDDAVR